MGITNLNKIISEHASSVPVVTHLSFYAFKKIAIDISLYMYKYKASQGLFWIQSFLQLIVALRKMNVHCLFVYDGPSPIEKIQEQKKRKSSTESQKKRIALLEEELAYYRQTKEIGKTMLEVYQKKTSAVTCLLRPNLCADTYRNEIHEHIDRIVSENIAHRKSQLIVITEEDVQLTKDLFTVLEIPFITAPDEAERYASQLCVCGLVDAVLSEDTDVMVYGTPVFLTNINLYNYTVTEIKSEILLSELKMDLTVFRDMCILLGCDYNTNIPFYGMKSVYQLIMEHKTIENVLIELQKKKKEIDGACLNYERCRELFSVNKETCFPFIPYCNQPDFEKVQDFLKENNIEYDTNILKHAMSFRNNIQIK